MLSAKRETPSRDLPKPRFIGAINLRTLQDKFLVIGYIEKKSALLAVM